MGRMYSRKKGKSGSHKPVVKTIPDWIPYKEKELEMLIAKLAKEGLTPSQIGLHLRDSYGIPDIKTVIGKTITQVLAEKKMQKDLPEDILSLMRKAIQLSKHMQENKGDMTAKRGLQLTEAKINRLSKYYRTTGRIPAEWKYSLAQASFYVE
jgi:small subunit ribosomal protein S15